MTMFTIEILPAAEGDCLWVEYGDAAAPSRVLIDTGTPGTYRALARRIKALPEGERRFELFVVTHIDSDHIGAAPHLLDKRPYGVQFDDVWFNGWRHLTPDRLGERQAEQFSKALDAQRESWNAAFGGRAVVVPDDGPLPEHTLPGGMKLTLLSPYQEQLTALVPRWSDYLEAVKRREAAKAEAKEGDRLGEALNVEALAQSEFDEDDKEPNGSSIALLVEYDGVRVLLGADAFPGVIERSLDKLIGPAERAARLELAAFKICHHGSRRNTSPGLAQRIDAASWLVSSSGSRHKHPDRESLSRLLVHRPPGRQTRMLFNYASDFTEIWADPLLQRQKNYTVEYPPDGASGIVWHPGTQ